MECNDAVIEPRNVLSILCAAVHPGSTIKLTADGDDEQRAVEEISKLIDSLDE